MEPLKLFEVIYGTPWATPEQAEAVAVLHGRQIFEREKPHRELMQAHQDGDVMSVIWRQLARTV